MIIQGPLTLNWRRRKWGVLPRIENGEIAYHNLPSRERIELWIRQRICVVGAEDTIFIKLHTHGAQDKNIKALLTDGALDHLYSEFEAVCHDNDYDLHYATAYDIYQTIKAIEHEQIS